MSLVLDEATHVYTWNGGEVPGVTSVIRSALGDPFARVPSGFLQRKRIIGTAAHKACELDADGRLDESSIHPDVKPYLDAWRRFRAEMPCRVIASERKLYSRVYGFAGRPDFYLLLLLSAAPTYAVVDIKTGFPTFAAGLQTAGYSILLQEEFGREEIDPLRFTLQLKKDGRYRFEPCTAVSDTRNFLACLAVHRMKENI